MGVHLHGVPYHRAAPPPRCELLALGGTSDFSCAAGGSGRTQQPARCDPDRLAGAATSDACVCVCVEGVRVAAPRVERFTPAGNHCPAAVDEKVGNEVHCPLRRGL